MIDLSNLKFPAVVHVINNHTRMKEVTFVMYSQNSGVVVDATDYSNYKVGHICDGIIGFNENYVSIDILKIPFEISSYKEKLESILAIRKNQVKIYEDILNMKY